MKHIYALVACLITTAVLQSNGWSNPLTRKEVDQQLSAHESNLQSYILKTLDALLVLSETESDNAGKSIGTFVAALEDLPSTQLKIAHDTLDILNLDGIEGIKEVDASLAKIIQEKHSAILKYIKDFEENDLTDNMRPFTQALFDFKNFAEEKLAHANLQESVLTKDQLSQLETTDMVAEYKALKQEDFMEASATSACALYSFLWAVKETPSLDAKFQSAVLPNLRKDKNGNYYILIDNKAFKFTSQNLANLNEKLHPSKSMLVKLLGLYAVEKMGLTSPENYNLTDPSSGHDYFFDKPTLAVGNSIVVESDIKDMKTFKIKPGMTLLKEDGTLVTNTGNSATKVSGKFVLAVSIGGLHSHGVAVAIYYDTTQGKWKLFNNIRVGVEDMNESAIINAAGVNLVQIIGDFKASKS